MLLIHSQKLINFHQSPFLFIVIGTSNTYVNSSITPLRELFIPMGALHGYQSQPSPHVIYHTKKFKMHLIVSLVHISDPMKPIVLIKMSEYSFHDSSDPTLLLITLILAIRQGTVPIGLVKYTTINTLASQYTFLRADCVSLVGKHSRLISTKQFVKFLRIMNTGGSKTFLTDDTRTFIYSNLSFVTIIDSLAPFKKIRIIVLLRKALPFTCLFIHHTLFSLIRTASRLDNTGIYESSTMQDELFFPQHVDDMIKKLLQNSRLHQLFSKSQYGSKIRNLFLSQSRIDKTDPQKSLKRKTVYQRILQLRIAQIIKVLKKQIFQRINDWHSGTYLTSGFVQGFYFFFQQLPVHKLINLFQKLVT